LCYSRFFFESPRVFATGPPRNRAPPPPPAPGLMEPPSPNNGMRGFFLPAGPFFPPDLRKVSPCPVLGSRGKTAPPPGPKTSGDAPRLSAIGAAGVHGTYPAAKKLAAGPQRKLFNLSNHRFRMTPPAAEMAVFCFRPLCRLPLSPQRVFLKQMVPPRGGFPPPSSGRYHAPKAQAPLPWGAGPPGPWGCPPAPLAPCIPFRETPPLFQRPKGPPEKKKNEPQAPPRALPPPNLGKRGPGFHTEPLIPAVGAPCPPAGGTPETAFWR